jgi:RNA polymerase sigma-B factor
MGLDPSREMRRRLTAELFAELAQTSQPRAQERLRERLVLTNTGVARNVARHYRDRGLDSEDVDQTAYVALIRAVQKFDPTLGHDFLSYAVPTIRGEIKRHFRDHGWTIRVPRRIQETQGAIDRADPDVDGNERCSNARISALAQQVGMPEEDVADALAARGCFAPTSLDELVNANSSATRADGLADDHNWVAPVEARVLLKPLVGRLSPRDQRTVYLRYVEEHTQQTIADELGVTQMQVSRILARIHSQLRDALGGDSMPPARAAG